MVAMQLTTVSGLPIICTTRSVESGAHCEYTLMFAPVCCKTEATVDSCRCTNRQLLSSFQTRNVLQTSRPRHFYVFSPKAAAARDCVTSSETFFSHFFHLQQSGLFRGYRWPQWY